MKVILLAAGLGTRLRPLTNTIPKCLAPIHGKPLLQIWLERLTEAGFGPFLINTHYLPEQIEGFVAKSPFRDQITLVYEPELLGTAGTLIKNLDFFQGEDGMLIHADNYCLADFSAFRQAHLNRPAGCLMTMMTFCTDDPSSCGIVEVDERGVVAGFHEKVESPPGNLSNGAVYALSREFLAELGTAWASDIRDFSTEILYRFMAQIHTYQTNEIFLDIGTPRNYEKANLGNCCETH